MRLPTLQLTPHTCHAGAAIPALSPVHASDLIVRPSDRL